MKWGEWTDSTRRKSLHLLVGWVLPFPLFFNPFFNIKKTLLLKSLPAITASLGRRLALNNSVHRNKRGKMFLDLWRTIISQKRKCSPCQTQALQNALSWVSQITNFLGSYISWTPSALSMSIRRRRVLLLVVKASPSNSQQCEQLIIPRKQEKDIVELTLHKCFVTIKKEFYPPHLKISKTSITSCSFITVGYRFQNQTGFESSSSSFSGMWAESEKVFCQGHWEIKAAPRDRAQSETELKASCCSWDCWQFQARTEKAGQADAITVEGTSRQPFISDICIPATQSFPTWCFKNLQKLFHQRLRQGRTKQIWVLMTIIPLSSVFRNIVTEAYYAKNDHHRETSAITPTNPIPLNVRHLQITFFTLHSKKYRFTTMCMLHRSHSQS